MKPKGSYKHTVPIAILGRMEIKRDKYIFGAFYLSLTQQHLNVVDSVQKVAENAFC
jgi:hypothetical protein